MNREKRLRRVGLLCCHFVRNAAYYKAGWENGKTKATNDFWLTVQGNFMDTAVLEWLKLFGNHDDKHHWKKIVCDPPSFKEQLLTFAGISEAELKDTIKEFKTYRDKFVAHLDSEEIMHIPILKNAEQCAYHYYEYVAKELGNSIRNLPCNLQTYYQQCFTDAETLFGK